MNTHENDTEAELAAWELLAETREELTAVTEQRDRLAEALQRIRNGYGGQVVCPDCGCDDCAYLRPIDKALQSLNQLTEL